MRRITPAHAGKSAFDIMGFMRTPDHPRTRGEKADAENYILKGVGSPPHTRGKGGAVVGGGVGGGITPAHAGKSASSLACFDKL